MEFQPQHQFFQRTPRTDLLLDRLVRSPCNPRDSQESSPAPEFKSVSPLVLSLLYSPDSLSVSPEQRTDDGFKASDCCKDRIQHSNLQKARAPCSDCHHVWGQNHSLDRFLVPCHLAPGQPSQEYYDSHVTDEKTRAPGGPHQRSPLSSARHTAEMDARPTEEWM